jgi:hypothetical protein
MSSATTAKMNSQANAFFSLGLVTQAANGFDVRTAKSGNIDVIVYHVEASFTGKLICKCASLSAPCYQFEDEGVCAHILASEMLAEKILEEIGYEAMNKPEPARTEMVCLSDRKKEFVEALNRAEKSDLEVFPDWDRDSFVVVNNDKGNEYKINLDSDGGRVFAECDCPDFVFRKRVCKHIGAVLTDTLFGILARK